MLTHGYVNTIYAFLARNRNREIENELLHIIGALGQTDESVQKHARRYLDERMLKKLHYTPLEPEPTVGVHRRTTVRRLRLLGILCAAACLFPVAFVVRHFPECFHTGFIENSTRFVVDGNYYLVFYSTCISSIYLVILFFSALGALRQQEYSKVKKGRFCSGGISCRVFQ